METAKRKQPRSRVLWAAQLQSEDGQIQVRVKDLSNTGARVICYATLRPGSDVMFQHQGLFVPAYVIWVKGDEVGLGFYRDVDPGD